ncbi:hypothetical protein RQP46_003797 [Phenoliferia psychrophenolica]
MTTFTPLHSQPVSVASLVALEPDTLTAEISRLQNSIAHLERSNRELLDFLHPPPTGALGGAGAGAGQAWDDEEALDEETKREFELSIEENRVTIARQEERLVMIRLAMEQKLGVDATNNHYDVVGRANGSGTAGSAPSSASGGADGDAAMSEQDAQVPMPGEEDDGMYL